MQKTYLPYDQDQLLLLPPSIREWVELGDLAHLIGPCANAWNASC